MGACEHSLMESETIFSARREAKSSAESEDDREVLEVGGKKL